MDDWTRESDGIHIVKKPRMGCAYIFIGVLGALITAGAALFLLGSALTEGMNIGHVYGTLVLMFGLVFLLGGLGGRKFNFKSFVDIGPDDVRFRRNQEDEPYRLDIGEVDHIVSLKVMKSSGGENSTTYPTYQIFLRKRDGAFFWLDTFRKEQELVDALDLLHEFLGLEIRDSSGLKQNKPAVKQYDPLSRPESREHSSFVKIENESGVRRIGIRGPRELMTSLLKVLVFGLFLGVPATIAFGVFADAGRSDAGVFAWIPMIFVGLFVLVFVSLVLVIMLMTLRRFELEIVPGKILVHQRFPLPLKFMDTITEVAAGMIRAVRVNRLDEGHFSLSLAVDEAYKGGVQGSSLARVMLLLSAFQKPGTQLPEKNRLIINLWEIPGYQKPGGGADYRDLHYLEQLLERELGVRE